MVSHRSHSHYVLFRLFQVYVSYVKILCTYVVNNYIIFKTKFNIQ